MCGVVVSHRIFLLHILASKCHFTLSPGKVAHHQSGYIRLVTTETMVIERYLGLRRWRAELWKIPSRNPNSWRWRLHSRWVVNCSLFFTVKMLMVLRTEFVYIDLSCGQKISSKIQGKKKFPPFQKYKTHSSLRPTVSEERMSTNFPTWGKELFFLSLKGK